MIAIVDRFIVSVVVCSSFICDSKVDFSAGKGLVGFLEMRENVFLE